MSIANNNVVAKIAALAAGLALVGSSFAFAVPAQAATVAELEAQVAALLAQLQQMQGGAVTAGAAFTMDLTIGASGAEVTRLQNWLIGKGYSIPAGATGYFGAQTAAAVGAYQSANGISPAVGYFGPMTRAKVNASLGGSTGGDTGGDTGSDSDLEGGAGSIDSYTLISSLNNEEVGEDEEDVEVAGLEIEVDDGSDIELTAVRLVFDEGTAASDFEDYAAEVSIWLDGEEVARVDGDEFNDDNSWTKTVSLDGGAVIDAGDTGELVVAISGIGNLDSADATDTWTVDFTSVRFRDADGATISEDPSTGTRTFSFQTFANAANVELKVSLTDDADEINDGHVVNIHADNDTDGVEILAFTLEAEGDSDLEVKDLPVEFFTSEDYVSDVITTVYLFADGDQIGSETVSSSTAANQSITFSDIDYTVDAGEEVEFTVEVDIQDVSATLASGTTIRAEIGATERAAADVEDESGENLASGDRTGTAIGEAHGLYDSGIMVEFVSASESVTSPETGADRGTFVVTFDVTAFDSDAYVDNSAPLAAGGSGESDLTITGTGTVIATITSPSGATAGTDGFQVKEGKTERFSITTNITATADGFFAVALGSIAYALTDADATTYYSFNLDEFKTDNVYLDTNA